MPSVGEPEHLAKRELGLARVAGGTGVVHAGLAVADPREHASQVAVVLTHGGDGVDGLAVDQSEVARIDGHRDLTEAPHDAVEPRGRRLLADRLAGPFVADGVDDVVALAPLASQLQRDLGGILQVAVHDDGGPAVGVVEPGADGDLVAEVARQPDRADPGIALAERLGRLVGAVSRPVVDEEHLGGAVELVHDTGQSPVQLVQVLPLIQNGDDEGVVGDDGSSSSVVGRRNPARAWPQRSNDPVIAGGSTPRHRVADVTLKYGVVDF